jgi:hypothetical protein
MLSGLQPFGPFTFVTGATALEENCLVEIFTDGTVIKCGADRVPIGFTQYASAIGVTATIYQAIGEATVKCGTGGCAIGDYLKSDANGHLICNGASGSTVNDAKTVAVARSAGTNDGDMVKVFFIHAA